MNTEKCKIFYIKMGAGKNRDLVCDKYLTDSKDTAGIFLGWNECREEAIKKAIQAEMSMKDKKKELSDDDIKKCWKPVLADLGRIISNNGVRTRAMNNIRDVCMATENDIFFTFHNGKMWWCHPLGNSEENVVFNDPVYKLDDLQTKVKKEIRESDLIRRTDGWKSTRVTGEPLEERMISGRLTRKQMIQGTMARLHEENSDIPEAPSDKELFLWTIGEEEDKELATFDSTLKELKRMTRIAISRLNPKDFENFVDMILVKNGWIRTGGIGSNIKSIDGEYIKPITGETVLVQVKARLSEAELIQASLALCDISGSTKQNIISYFVYHTLSGELKDKETIKSKLKQEIGNQLNEGWLEKLQILDGDDLADLSIQSDIIEWLKRTAFPFYQNIHN